MGCSPFQIWAVDYSWWSVHLVLFFIKLYSVFRPFFPTCLPDLEFQSSPPALLIMSRLMLHLKWPLCLFIIQLSNEMLNNTWTKWVFAVLMWYIFPWWQWPTADSEQWPSQFCWPQRGFFSSLLTMLLDTAVEIALKLIKFGFPYLQGLLPCHRRITN